MRCARLPLPAPFTQVRLNQTDSAFDDRWTIFERNPSAVSLALPSSLDRLQTIAVTGGPASRTEAARRFCRKFEFLDAHRRPLCLTCVGAFKSLEPRALACLPTPESGPAGPATRQGPVAGMAADGDDPAGLANARTVGRIAVQGCGDPADGASGLRARLLPGPKNVVRGRGR